VWGGKPIEAYTSPPYYEPSNQYKRIQEQEEKVICDIP
jgi:hypothetical protein